EAATGPLLPHHRLGEEARSESERYGQLLQTGLQDHRIIGSSQTDRSPQIYLQHPRPGLGVNRAQLDTETFTGALESFDEAVHPFQIHDVVAEASCQGLVSRRRPDPDLVFEGGLD